ncbi:hypothetical protein K8R66_03860 [bacterium]|nr:hypothetical protein [bacterium]
MKLKQTKIELQRLVDRYGEILERSNTDIKPIYSKEEINLARGIGYYYSGIDEPDIHIIYGSIISLSESINHPNSVIFCDLDYYVTETNIVRELEKLKDSILYDLNELNKLYKKYCNKECNLYPIKQALHYHQEIFNLLDDIFKSDEMMMFLNPGKFEKLLVENTDLKFKEFWRKRKWKYINHLISFILFLLIAATLMIIYDQGILNIYIHTTIGVVIGLMTVAFNIFFNNHSSFKNSFKLIYRPSRRKLIEKEKNDFITENNNN